MLRTLTLTGSWQALPSLQGGAVEILNTSGVSVSIRYVHDSSNTITVPTGTPVRIPLHGGAAMKGANVEVNGASGDIQLIFS